MIPRERLTSENRGGGGGGEEKLQLHAVIVCLANTIHWIDGSSDWCGFRCSTASCQSRSCRIIYFLGLPHSVFFNTLIHADFENFHSVVEEALSVLRVMHIAY